ncbi:hypothetical protein RB195_014009 [Necator americanus]|uniref:Uncharacterized protein n=1 Tax=Necator americanus TaxID=51031 RepID=A0ABR1DYA9_NECAM
MWESPDRDIMKFTTSSSLKGYPDGCRCCTKVYTGSDHPHIRGRFSFTRKGGKTAKFTKRTPRTIIDLELFASLVGFWEDTVMEKIDDEYEQLVGRLHDCTREAKSFKTTKRRLSPKIAAEAGQSISVK